MTRTINFNWKQLGRTLVCFVLICCLMVNISPLRAKALIPEAVFAVKSVMGSIAISSISNAIGLAAGNTADAFSAVVSSCQTFLEERGWIVNGLAKIGLATMADGTTRSFFLRDMIEDIRSWLHGDGGVLTATEGYAFPYSDSEKVMAAYHEMMSYPFHCVAYNITQKCWYFYGANYELAYTYDASVGGYFIGCNDGRAYYYRSANGAVSSQNWTNKGSTLGTFINITDTGLVSDISTSLDLTLGDIASPDTSLEEGYATWSTGAVSVPNADTGEDDVYYPVSIPSASTSVGTLTQTDAQAGSISQEMVDSLVGTDTEVDTGTATETVTVTGFASLVQFLTGTTVVASPLEAINFGAMFDLFPFNIPAGIYETINFWSASATPPVITIPLPIVTGGGVTIDEYTLDLGEIPGMNTLAALIRGGELILFAIGLLLITRKVTKW